MLCTVFLCKNAILYVENNMIDRNLLAMLFMMTSDCLDTGVNHVNEMWFETTQYPEQLSRMASIKKAVASVESVNKNVRLSRHKK